MADPYAADYQDAGRAWNVDPDLIRAIHSGESGFDDSATSPSGAAGRGQFMPGTARGLGITNPRDPVQAIFGTAKLMSQSLDQSNGDVAVALKLYQGGPNRAGWGAQNAAYPGYIMGHYQRLPQQGGNAPLATPVSAAAPDAAPTDTNPVIGNALMRAREGVAARGTQAAPAAAAAPAAPTAPGADAFEAMFGTPAPAPTPAAPAPDASGDAFGAAFAPLTVAPAATSAAAPVVSAVDKQAADMARTYGNAPAASIPAGPDAEANAIADAYSTPRVDAANGRRSLLAGAKQGVGDVGGTLATGMDRVAQYVNDRVPMMAALDRATGMDPARNIAAIQQDKAAYEAQYGTDPTAQVGRIGGQLVATTPFMGGANALAGAVGTRLAGPGVGAFLTGQAGNGLLRAPSLAAQGGLMGGTAALATGEDVPTGAVTGALAGPVAGGLFATARGAANMLAGRGASSVAPDVARLADMAQNTYGIPLRADQLSSSGAVKMAGDVVNRLPLSGGSEFNRLQLGAFNRAVANTIGETADAITPAVMQRARVRIGQDFNDVAAQTSIPVQSDPTLLNRLGQIENEAARVLPGNGSDPIRNQVSDILDKAVQHNGTVPGDVWQALTRRGTPLDVLTQSNDPGIRTYAGQVREALNDALERSLPANSPLLPQLQGARSQWRAMKTIEPLVAKTTTGDVSPALVMARAMANDPQMAYSGGGPLGDLARIGQQFLKVPANSGTPERMGMMRLLGNAGQIGAAGLGLGGAAYVGAALPAAASLGGSLIAGRLAGSALRNPAVVNRLIQNSINPTPAFGGALSPQLEPYLSGAGSLLFPNPTGQ